MRRSRAMVALLGSLMLVLGFAGRQPARAAVDSNEMVEEIAYVYSECTGEVLEVDRKFHTVFATTVDAQGGIHVFGRVNGAGTQAVGQTSGDKYVAPVHNTFFHVTLTAGGASTFSAPFGFVLVSQGKAPNMQLMATFHFTVNANGTVTATVDNFRIECRGAQP
jgi:hypothetical protein